MQNIVVTVAFSASNVADCNFVSFPETSLAKWHFTLRLANIWKCKRLTYQYPCRISVPNTLTDRNHWPLSGNRESYMSRHMYYTNDTAVRTNYEHRHMRALSIRNFDEFYEERESPSCARARARTYVGDRRNRGVRYVGGDTENIYDYFPGTLKRVVRARDGKWPSRAPLAVGFI